ncbi:glycosyltransferase involved in cell wall biosynthesis [Actinoplanes campanulatus]|uniref:Glycosyltransferase involved in cell wall biosynthesis n=1 Tax=Actinoplanes campanulatus TaxID=113559 RepID=A0A7W5FFW2_9ACTN|nr:glycosyltransferase involved in cell wall biosynthesis [Actinoplanes campanulatus]GGN44326.1 hypothetical protein GCM10010109_77400 [Actinoplanes campanulatus]GID37352.1 hypothetical protein Aca09nite_38580 [Actinoplanes campanulatus]
MIHTLFAVLPASIDDPAAPSGGNRYDREVLRRLTLPGAPSPASGDQTPSPVRRRPAPEAQPLPAALPHPAREDQTLPPVRPQPTVEDQTLSVVRPQPAPDDQTPFAVREKLVPGDWPRPAPAARRALSEILADIPDGATVLLDGLIACGVPDLLEPHATRLRLVILVHLPLSDETGLTPETAADLRARERRALHLAAAVIATSTPAARRVEELHDLTGVHAVPPGVDPAPPAVPSPTGHRLLMVASLTPRKGYHLLLQALQTLTDLRWTCTVTGAGQILGEVPTPATLTLTPPTALSATLDPNGNLLSPRRTPGTPLIPSTDNQPGTPPAACVGVLPGTPPTGKAGAEGHGLPGTPPTGKAGAEGHGPFGAGTGGRATEDAGDEPPTGSTSDRPGTPTTTNPGDHADTSRTESTDDEPGAPAAGELGVEGHGLSGAGTGGRAVEGGWRISRPERDGPVPEEGSVRFTGPLGGAALDAVYADADLFVLPSYAETYGMVVTEALARGLPVLATDVGGVPEALGEAGGGRPGRLIPPGDRDALAGALREWLTDPALRARWRDRARARRETLTSWDETANRIREVLDALP